MDKFSDEKVKKFIILTTQRFGSTLFRWYLNSHPFIRAGGEVFLQYSNQYDGYNSFLAKYLLLSFLIKKKYRKMRFTWNMTKIIHRYIPFSIVRRYLSSFFYNPEHSASLKNFHDQPKYTYNVHFAEEKAREFKLMYNQLKWNPYLKNWALRNNISIIHLIRENLLRIYISLLRLHKTRLPYTLRQVKTEPVYIYPDKLSAFLYKMNKLIEQHRRMFSTIPYIEVTFENFLNNIEAEKERILNFLGIEDREMSLPGLKKISSKDIKNDIVNYDEIVNFLKGTKYEKFLYSG